jgi:transposase InsO family protein
MTSTGVRPRSAASPARTVQAWTARAAGAVDRPAAEGGDDVGEDPADSGCGVADVDDGVGGGVEVGDGAADGGGLAGADLAGDHRDGLVGYGPGDAGGGLAAVGVPVQAGRRQVAAERHPGESEPGDDDEGKLHLASVLDMASRRVVGFALGQHHNAQLAYGALVMAVAVRGGQVPGVILHTDQGSEYTAGLVRQACQRLGVRQSMGRPGSALDNAVIESWHSTLEFELRSVEHFATRAAARARVSEWIEDYNTRRRHFALGMMSPASYEQALRDQAA